MILYHAFHVLPSSLLNTYTGTFVVALASVVPPHTECGQCIHLKGTVHPKLKFRPFSTHRYDNRDYGEEFHPVLIQWKPVVAMYSNVEKTQQRKTMSHLRTAHVMSSGFDLKQ